MNSPDLPIVTERLQLRPHTGDDARWLHAIRSQPAVARFLLDDPWSLEDSKSNAEERLKKTDLDGDSGALVLAIEHEGRAIGDVQLWLTDRGRRIAEIGWVLDPAYSGRGLATEAVDAVLRIAFEHYRLHRVVAQMDARNSTSARLASRVGMRREALLRQDWWSKGEWTDTVIFGMLAADRAGIR